MAKISRIGDVFIFNSSQGHSPECSVQLSSSSRACQGSRPVPSGVQVTDSRRGPQDVAGSVGLTGGRAGGLSCALGGQVKG